MDMNKILAYVQNMEESLEGLRQVIEERSLEEGAVYVDQEQNVIFVSTQDAVKILDSFGNNSESVRIGKTEYILLYDAGSKLNFDGESYIPSGYLVMKSCNGLQPVNEEDVERIVAELRNRTMTLALHQSFNGVYGFAVVFPWFSSDKIISSSSPRELTIDKSDIDNLPRKINEIFHYWRNKRNLSVPFSAEQRKRFISLINKRISLSAAAGALIPIKKKELSKINAIQDSIIDAMHNYREMRFIGGAGTGKTYIGAKKAKQEALRGKKVLFTCCSKGLINYVKNEVLKGVDDVACMDFDSLRAEYAKDIR